MFRQSKRTEETNAADVAVATETERDSTLPLVRRSLAGESAAEPSGGVGRIEQSVRRPTEPVPALRRTMPSMPSPVVPKPEPGEGKRLTVGRDICVRGEITACDVLVVEGRVEASIAGSNLMEIAETGLFKGDAEIDHAVIGGRFEGNLVVRDRLFIGATGKVTGSVRYRRLEIALGGELIGDAQVMGASHNGNHHDA